MVRALSQPTAQFSGSLTHSTPPSADRPHPLSPPSQQEQLPGLSSPGPAYNLPGSFVEACKKSSHPTWGRHGPGSLKSGRFRQDEVRFTSRRHMREFLGHFSPGPQYNLPTTVGGADGNSRAANARLLSIPATAVGGRRVSLSAADLSGADAAYARGSFSDATRPGAPEHAKGSTAYWRASSMLQPNENTFHNSAPIPSFRQVWHEDPNGALANTALQDDIKASMAARWRPAPSKPRRQMADFSAEPPFATNFGGECRDDFGVVGGVDTRWVTSKVSGVTTSGAPRIGPKPKTSKLRYAFVQPMGPNSVPRDAGQADFDGGRATRYKFDRATQVRPQSMLESRRSATGRSFAD